MKTIDYFLKETKFVTPIDCNSDTEIRFVICEVQMEDMSFKKNTSVDITDTYISPQERYRVIDSSDTKKYDEGMVFRIMGGAGEKNKDLCEIDSETMQDDLNGKPIMISIVKKGVGVVEFSTLGISGYCENVIARTKDRIIFDEFQVEFEDIKNNSQLEVLIQLINPQKVFQCSLFDYSINKARVTGIPINV